MDSMWFQILVIILSTLLAIFLVLGIVIAVFVVKITKTVKRITQQAEQVVDRADYISTFFKQTATPIALLKLMTNVFDAIGKKGGKK